MEGGHIVICKKGHFNSRLVCNKHGKNFVKVEKDLGMIMIFLGSSSPHKTQQAHLLF